MKAAVFDVDGTLVDSLEFWKNMAKNYLISIGISPAVDLNITLETLTVSEGIAYMREEYDIDKTYEEIRAEMDELLFAYYREEVKLKSYVVGILETLKSKDIRIAIASVIDEELIYSVLNRYGIDNYFEFVQTCENTGISKDDDGFYSLLIDRLGLKADDIYIFEDSLFAMKSAKRVGLNVVAVADDYAKKDLVEIIEVADIYIRDFGKLIGFLNL